MYAQGVRTVARMAGKYARNRTPAQIVGDAYRTIRTARSVYNAGRRTYDAVSSLAGNKRGRSISDTGTRHRSPPVFSVSTDRSRYVGTGVYKGRFVKKRKYNKRKRTKSVIPKAKLTDGLKIIKEEFGTVDDIDTAYIVNPSASDFEVIRLLVQVIIKRLLQRGIDWTCDSAEAEIQYGLSSTINPVGLGIILYGGNPATTDAKYGVVASYSMVDGDTVQTVATAFYNAFFDYSAGYTRSNNDNALELYQMALVSTVRNAVGDGTTVQQLATIHMDEIYVHWYGKSHLKVQNRTNSVLSSTSTEVNDAKPLEGYMYMFRGIPKTRIGATADFTTQNITLHTKTFGAATLPGSFKEPPPTKVFSNCRKRTRIRLDPGEIKTHQVSTRGNMKILPLLKKLNYQASVAGITSHALFDVQMLALEECINSTDVNAVTLGFENGVELSVAIAIKKRPIVSLPFYSVANITETT